MVLKKAGDAWWHANMAKDVVCFVVVDELPRPKALQFKTTEDRILFAKGTFRESKVSWLVRLVGYLQQIRNRNNFQHASYAETVNTKCSDNEKRLRVTYSREKAR